MAEIAAERAHTGVPRVDRRDLRENSGAGSVLSRSAPGATGRVPGSSWPGALVQHSRKNGAEPPVPATDTLLPGCNYLNTGRTNLVFALGIG